MNLKSSHQLKALVVGDFMLDHYIYGQSDRMSPEANVPVILPISDEYILGGAANVISNLQSLNVDVTCMGILGDDQNGKKINSLLKKIGIQNSFFIISKDFPTTLKRRVYLSDKQFVRIDYEKKHDDIFSNQLIETFEKLDKNFDFIILSDYNKGVLNKKLIDHIIENVDVPVIVDPKKNNFNIYGRATIITPNLNELSLATNINCDNKNNILSACNKVLNESKIKFIVATMGDKGMMVVGENFNKFISSIEIPNADVSGAGDTVVSSLSLSYIISNDIIYSSQVANIAASIAVSKKGTYAVKLSELNDRISNLI
ncbi:MAG: hypothetical protein CBE33_04200 [Candidatus Pelagibacter sp. TMED273]|nr:MAG: hypothetical protein CBE33_04200 [Candidatus Pelagibacter sp. TMED273]|tara:strand:- start:10011 stop:10955 length:945 start_codon:yes stop_codon:yes gene_type:complete